MTYRELTMIDVREMLRRWSAGQSLRKLSLGAGVDRGTARRYVEAAEALELPRDRDLTDAEVHQVAQRVQGRSAPDVSAERRELSRHLDRIRQWLIHDKPLRLRKVHTLLVRDHGVTASYDTLRRFAIEELGWRKRPPTVLVADGTPGEEAQLDFGKMGTLLDPETGRSRCLYALVVTLVVSRYQFVWPTFRQTTEAVCEGLDAAWRFFGAMPRVLIPDNMSAIVATADPLAPVIVPAFLDYTQHRGLFADPARVRSPKDKGRVENQVAYVRESWFAGERFLSLAEAVDDAARWCRDVAGKRIHGTTRKIPLEAFEAEEKPGMLPPPTSPFDVPVWSEAKVHPDHHIQVAKALYSVPTCYIGRTVRVRADRTLVRIYLGTELIKAHARVEPGRRATDPADYPEGKADYALRNVDGLLARARTRGAHVGIYAEKLLAGPLPWARMRQAYGLLRLCDTYGNGRVEAVCQSALAFDVVDVPRIARMLKAAIAPGTPGATAAKAGSSSKVVALQPPRFARSLQHFETRPSAVGQAAGKEEA
jgi:transposase